MRLYGDVPPDELIQDAIDVLRTASERFEKIIEGKDSRIESLEQEASDLKDEIRGLQDEIKSLEAQQQ